MRSETSLMQTIGRAARNVNAKVILYGDKVTNSMQKAIDETEPPAQAARGLQQAARHHARDNSQGDSSRDRSDGGRPRPGQRRGGTHGRNASTSPKSTLPNSKRKCWPRPMHWNSSGRRRSAIASRRCRTRWGNRWTRSKKNRAPAADAAKGLGRSLSRNRVEKSLVRNGACKGPQDGPLDLDGGRSRGLNSRLSAARDCEFLP